MSDRSGLAIVLVVALSGCFGPYQETMTTMSCAALAEHYEARAAEYESRGKWDRPIGEPGYSRSIAEDYRERARLDPECRATVREVDL